MIPHVLAATRRRDRSPRIPLPNVWIATCLLAATAASTPFPLAAAAATAAAPRYQFAPGVTNHYKITLETVHQERPVTLAGLVELHAIAVDANTLHLGLLGMLMPRFKEPAQGPEAPPQHFSRNIGPGGSGTYWAPRPIHIPPGTTFSIDPSGNLLRELDVSQSLPVPIDSFASLLIEALPDASSKRERALTPTLTLPDELAGPGPMGLMPSYYGGGFPGRGSPVLHATRTGSTRIADSQPDALHVATTAEIRSLMTSGDIPRLTASYKREAVFDRRLGQLRSLEMSGTATFTTPNLSLRRPFKVSVQRLEGADLQRELEARQTVFNPVPLALQPGELDKLLADLESSDLSRRGLAANRLQSADLPQATPALLAAAIRLSSDSDFGARAAGQRVLGLHGGEAEVPVMIRALTWGQAGGNQRLLIERLRHLKDPRALDPLADVVARGANDTDAAAEALRAFGPAAEPAALRLLKERHVQVRRMACELLGHVGSNAALEALRSQLTDPDPQVSQAATEALRSLQTRTGPTP